MVSACSKRARRSTPTSCSARSPAARPPTSTTPSRRRVAPSRPGRRPPGESAWRSSRRAAELISDRLFEYSATQSYEVGKNRIEALGEVEESADLIRYYAQTMEDNQGYDHPMGNLGDTAVHTRSILRPHGVFAVVSPFNFPMALCTGPSAAAMMAGNAVVIKPSSAAPLSAQNMLQAYIDAGVPKGVVNW
jgi:1-pyrroline-5-carboxylate dehydrogenase